VELDKDADVKIVDHFKKGNAAGTYVVIVGSI
jgi:hypothetical protein